MAAPATPRRSLIGRLVGGLAQYIATPSRATPPPESQPAAAQATSPASTQSEAQPTPPANDEWHPGMIQTKYLSEYANMFDDIINTPQRHIIRRSQTTPRKQQITRAHAAQMPRSAMKKRPAPGDDDEATTPSNNKRVKFNDRLVQERILSPPHPGERDSLPETRNFHSKKRPRATDPYMGKQFEDSPNIFDESPSKRARYESGEESTADSENTPTTQNNTRMNAELSQEPFVPNRAQPRPGTFELNYDTYAGDDESLLSEEKSDTSAEQNIAPNPPSTSTQPGRFALEYSDDSINPDESSLENDITPTPGPSHRPTRTDQAPALEPSTTQSEEETNHLELADDQPPTPPTPPNAAAIDAEMEALPWPEPVTYVEAGIASQRVIDLLNERYDQEDDYYAGLWWDREYSKFSKALKTAKLQGREIQIEC
jgi:hypothetical protein